MIMTDDTIQKRVDAIRWHHRIEVAPGVFTNGHPNCETKLREIEALGFPADLRGKRVLDIGAWDGYFSFEAERRGAKVVAMDHVERSATGFGIASELLGSKAEWITGNIYDLNPEEHGYFDVVLCLGVIYHLRHLLLAFDRMRSVMKPGAELYIETAALDRTVRIPDAQPVSLETAGALNNAPLLQLHSKGQLAGDWTNFFVPNLAGLDALLEASEFQPAGSSLGSGGLAARSFARGVAIDDPKVRFYINRDRATLSRRLAM